jgi:FdhD protein
LYASRVWVILASMRPLRRQQDPVAEASVAVERVRFRGSVARPGRDQVACEEPLEIRLGDVPLAVVMRTPGHDEELALGFLATERVIADPSQVLSVRHCGSGSDPEAADNVVRVRLQPQTRVDLEALRRNLYASASCGICGKATIDNALAAGPPLEDPARFRPALLYALPQSLEKAQPVFTRTGGLHAAALFDGQGRLRAAREDVGRHNAVDKIVGWALGRRLLPLSGHALLVSGRISYEIVQKALAARIPLVAAVSAPSSLAVGFAERARMTLVGFLRGRGFNVYGEADRVVRD